MIDYGENLLEKISDYLYLTFLDHVDCSDYLMWWTNRFSKCNKWRNEKKIWIYLCREK